MVGKRELPSASVELGESSLRVRMQDVRREAREMFKGLTPEERDALALDVWNAGLRAVSKIYRAPRAGEEAPKPTRLSTIPPSRW